MAAATELINGFAELTELGMTIAGGGQVPDEKLAALRKQNKSSVARLKAAVKANQENET